jgi:hypothetical protein
MKRLPHSRTIILISAALPIFCGAGSLQTQETPRVETSKKVDYHSVGGYRHGPSYFKKVRYAEAQPLKKGELDFSHYHSYEEVNSFLRTWADKYPDILELCVAGKSFEGRDILQLTLTNKKTGKATDKPAMTIDAARHSGEITASESALWLLNHLLTSYGTDGGITRLVDTRALYFRIQNNPDGAELFCQTAQSCRSSVRPHDSDRDGLLDEDPAEDLDGDGFIRQMRKRVDMGKGNAVLDPRDSSGRLMKMVPENEGDWMVYTEGIDNDEDGKFNEDGIGGLDLHRNYPENWRPDEGGDASGRGWTQPGAGEFPLSEPETRSFVLFLLSNPQVAIVNSMDTAVPMHLHGPSTSKSEDRMYPEDLAWYRYFDREGMKITGYPWAGDTYDVYHTRVPTDPVTGEPTKPSPLFGHGPDFGYWYYGAIWYGDELWNGGAIRDYNNDGLRDSFDALCWNDEALGGKAFAPWAKYQHPQLGEVEIGGFNPKFFLTNPPPQFLEEWASKEARFNLMLAGHLPQIEITKAEVKSGGEKDAFIVTVSFTNTGELPTALEQAKLVKIVRPDTVRLEFDESLVKDPANRKVETLEPKTRDKDVELGWTKKGEIKTAEFKVQLKGIAGAKCKVHVLSTRGGHAEREVTLGTVQ